MCVEFNLKFFNKNFKQFWWIHLLQYQNLGISNNGTEYWCESMNVFIWLQIEYVPLLLFQTRKKIVPSTELNMDQIFRWKNMCWELLIWLSAISTSFTFQKINIPILMELKIWISIPNITIETINKRMHDWFYSINKQYFLCCTRAIRFD